MTSLAEGPDNVTWPLSDPPSMEPRARPGPWTPGACTQLPGRQVAQHSEGSCHLLPSHSGHNSRLPDAPTKPRASCQGASTTKPAQDCPPSPTGTLSPSHVLPHGLPSLQGEAKVLQRPRTAQDLPAPLLGCLAHVHLVHSLQCPSTPPGLTAPLPVS